jgi:hypothetical protein
LPVIDKLFSQIWRCVAMASRKIIKKLLQFAVVVLFIVIALPTSAFLLLQNNSIQNSVVTKVMRLVSDKLGTKFTVSSIDIAFLYRIRLNDVYLQDISGDTLIYSESITTGIRYIDPLRKKISIASIGLDNARIFLVSDDVKGLNLKYFIDKLKGNGEKKNGKWTIDFNNLRLEDSHFSLRNTEFKPKDFGVNYTDLAAYEINAEIRRFKPSKDSLSFFVRSLSFKEKSGLVVKNLSSRFSQSQTFLSFRDIELTTDNSNISGNDISLKFNNYNAFKTFTDSVRLRVDLQNSILSLGDIGFFAPAFREYNQKIEFSGLVTGPIAKIRAKGLTIGYGNSSKLKGNLQFEGLPDIRQTFILADIEEFSTSAADINGFELLRNREIRMPEQVIKLGNINYAGNFTGFINDFVAYGQFNTDLGIIRTDLLFRPDSLNQLNFEGRINAKEFDLGTLADASDKIGNISLSATIDGATVAGKSINATLRGVIEQLDLMQYRYTNISLSGDMNNKTFNGSVNVNDPNIDLEFLGKVDFSDSIPSFDFTANITDANFYALNITHNDPDFRASFYVIANAFGNSINSINGEIKLVNSLFIKKDKQLQIYDLNLSSESTQGNNHLKLRSEFIDADISGNFELNKAGEIFKRFIYSYLPSLLNSTGLDTSPVENTIQFTSEIKDIKPLMDFFAPDFSISEKSLISLSYEPADRLLKVHLEATSVRAKNLIWRNLNLNAFSNEGLLQFEMGSEIMTIGNKLNLENFTAIANASNDTAGIHLHWNNWQDLQYKGTISALAEFSKNSATTNPHIQINIRPSDCVTRDTLWSVQPGIITIDSTAVAFKNVSISHNHEYFRIDGMLSENVSDQLNVVFNKFNLANLNTFAGSAGYNFGGVLNGNAKLSGIYSNPLFTSLLEIDSLVINNEMLGTTEINSSWNDARKSILLEAFALRDNLKTIDIKGEYIPTGEGKLDFDLELEKLRLNLFNPYVSAIFEDLRGIGSGKLSLTGSLKKPLINGEINLQKTTFTVGYLQTRYSFSDKIQIENNSIYFNDIRIFDAHGNSAWLNGAIRNRYLKDFVLDLNIRAENFMSMNTTLAHNDNFYGTAFATGTIKIQGPPKNLFMDITATSNANTSVRIPLSSSGELNEYPFISVRDIYGDDNSGEDESDYQADLSGVQIRCRLTVTPDADVQIIIDPQLGEIIRGRGTGNIDLRINPAGDFLMTGEYVIEDGDYLFTLQKLINKKLTIEPGGSIRWEGDPIDATVDIVATYRTRSSLKDLLGEKEDDDQNMIVDDRVILSGKLMSPDIRYDIYLPDADETTRLKVAGAMTTSEEKSRQFISLLINQKFALSQERGGLTNSSSYASAAGVNFSEMLSNQLSNWLSQIVNDLDVDVNYRQNREMNSDEVQLALSYQLFNDKLTINGSVGATNAASNASDEIVGEFDIDYKLTDNGKLRLKTFNHANNELLYEDNSSYTQGLGFTYKEEFNTFGELIRRWFGKKEDNPEPKDDDETPGDDDNADPPVVNNYP